MIAIKNLVVIRHAKSSWDSPALSDLERPLNHRGVRDAPFMGNLLKSRGLLPDRILCSPAVRAGMTARLLADAVGYDVRAIDVHQEIYEQGVSGLMSVIHGLHSGWNRVYLIGHNPDLSRLVDRLTGESLGDLPTCGVASLVFDVERWPHIMEGSGRLSLFDYPKRYSRGA